MQPNPVPCCSSSSKEKFIVLFTYMSPLENARWFDKLGILDKKKYGQVGCVKDLE